MSAIEDALLFAPWFRDRSTWKSWFAFLSAVFGLPMTEEQVGIYRQCTGRGAAPAVPATEVWLSCGRRSGKSFVLALIAVFLACFRSYQPFLTPGERATVLIVATDRKQARVIFRYVRALLTGVPMLAKLVVRETADSFDLSNAVTIEVGAASYRSTRGYAFAAVLCDEIAFWPSDDAAEPDYAILDAIRPGMATIPNAMLLCASSPYAKRGALFDAYKRYFGTDDPAVLVWQAATRTMNPTVSQAIIDRAMERDASAAASEWLALWRSDLDAYVSPEVLEACVDVGVRERPPLPGVYYYGFLDAAGGSGSDSMTLAISSREGRTLVLNAVRERRPPFSPESVVVEFSELLKSYGVHKIRADRFGGSWPIEAFGRSGIRVEPSDRTKSQLYVDVLAELNSKQVALLDHPRLITQFCSLERRASSRGDIIDHPPNQHDDLANAVAGAVLLAKPRVPHKESPMFLVQVGAGQDILGEPMPSWWMNDRV